MTYNVELIHEKDPSSQLEASKSSIKDFLNDLLGKTKGCNIKLLSNSC